MSCDEIQDLDGDILIGSVIDPFGNHLGIIEMPTSSSRKSSGLAACGR